MADVEKLVFQRFATLFGEPKHTSNLAGFYDEYERALSGCSDELLARAIDDAIDKHAYPTWPTLGQIKTSLKAVTPSAGPPQFREPPPDRPPPSPIAKANVQRLVDQLKQDMAAAAPPPRSTHYPNRGAHGLSAVSKRMTGEGE